MPTVFRTGSARALAGVVMALCVFGVALGMVRSGAGTLWTAGPWAAAIAVTIWAVYWRPRVVIRDEEVQLVNILRTVSIPWTAIRSVDTKWTLTLVTDDGRFAAWASPGPGGMAKARAAQRARREEARLGSLSMFGGRTLPVAARASVADVINERWAKTQAGETASAASSAAPTISWHWPVIIAVPVLVALALLATFA